MQKTEEYLDVFDENNQPTGVAFLRQKIRGSMKVEHFAMLFGYKVL